MTNDTVLWEIDRRGVATVTLNRPQVNNAYNGVVEETLDPGASVSVVARRHGLTPQQVFAWRREARQRSEEAGPSFIPAMVELASTPRRRRQQAAPMAAIELDIGGVRVRIGDGAKASIVSAVIRALKATS